MRAMLSEIGNWFFLEIACAGIDHLPARLHVLLRFVFWFAGRRFSWFGTSQVVNQLDVVLY